MSLTEHPQDQTYVLSLWWGKLRRPETLSMEEIATIVADRHGVDLKSLRSKSRLQHLVEARWEAMAKMRETGRFPVTWIGRYFHRERSTIHHALRAFAARSPA